MHVTYSVGVVQRTAGKRNPNPDDPWDGESEAQPGKHQLSKSFSILKTAVLQFGHSFMTTGVAAFRLSSLSSFPSLPPPFLPLSPLPFLLLSFLFIPFFLFLPPSCILPTFYLVLSSFFWLQVLYSDSFRKQVQGKAAYVLDTPEMRRVRETQKHISTVRALLCMSVT